VGAAVAVDLAEGLVRVVDAAEAQAVSPIPCKLRLATLAATVCSANALRLKRVAAMVDGVAARVGVVAMRARATIQAPQEAAHVKISKLFFTAIFFTFLGHFNGYRTHSLHHQT
jgi:hypothetical protein